MNFTYLKYVVEIEKHGSMTLAAKELNVAQPNLSKAVKELEKKLGIKIFVRTATGVKPTHEGLEFLENAKEIVNNIDSLVDNYKSDHTNTEFLKISCERATYIAIAFTEAVNEYEGELPFKIDYKETTSKEVLDDVIKNNASLGIIKCRVDKFDILNRIFKDNGIEYEIIWEYPVKLIVPKTSFLNTYDLVGTKELTHSVELLGAEYQVPDCDFLTPFISTLSKNNNEDLNRKKIYFHDRGSRTNLIYGLKEAFTFATPMYDNQLKDYGLNYVETAFEIPNHTDLVIYKDKNKLSDLEKKFIYKLSEITRQCKKNQYFKNQSNHK